VRQVYRAKTQEACSWTIKGLLSDWEMGRKDVTDLFYVIPQRLEFSPSKMPIFFMPVMGWLYDAEYQGLREHVR